MGWTHRGAAVALRRFASGDGRLIVLLPPLVAAGYRCVWPEPRGFGSSRGPLDCTLADLADDVAAAIEAESGGPAVLAGAAFGNRVARMLAVRRSELVRGHCHVNLGRTA